jgi:hypothetical protein
VAYSTTTRNLRELAAAGRAHKLTDDAGRTLWRLPQPDTDVVNPERVRTDAADDTARGTARDTAADPGVVRPSVPDKEPDEEPDEELTAAAPDAEGGDPAQPAPPSPAAEPLAGVDEVDNETTDPAGDGEQAAGTGKPAATATPQPAQATGAAATHPPQQPARSATPRRASGTLDGAVLDILEAHPEQGFKVSQLCKLIDATNEGSDTAKASPGAVVLAAQRLARKGKAVLAVEKPATFQLAQASGE